MSHAWGAVKFGDGTIMYYEYNGTTDFVVPRLYPDEQGVRDNWRSDDYGFVFNKCVCGKESEPVEIMSTYGGMFWWRGKACRTCMTITEGIEPLWYVQGDNSKDLIQVTWDGEPDWSPYKSESGYDSWRGL